MEYKTNTDLIIKESNLNIKINKIKNIKAARFMVALNI